MDTTKNIIRTLKTNTFTRHIITAITQLACSFLLSRGILLDSFAPLGTAFCAACAAFMSGEGRTRRLLPFAPFLGTVISYLSASNIDGLKYASAATLAFSAGIIFRDTDLYRRRSFMPISAAISILCTNAIYLITDDITAAHVILYIGEAIICGAAAYFYINVASLLSPELCPEDYFDPQKQSPNVSDVRFLGGGKLGTWGICRSSIRDRHNEDKLSFLAGCITMLMSSSPSGSISIGMLIPPIFNIIAMMHIFLPTHRPYIPKRTAPEGDTLMKHSLMHKLEVCRDALREFCSEMNRRADSSEPTVEPISRAFESVTERVCRTCPQSSICWGQAYTDTKNAFNDASLKIREQGRAVVESFPPYFTVRCVRMAELIGVINEGLSLAEASRQLKMQKYEDIRLMRAQYSGLTAVIGDMADTIDTYAASSAELIKPTIGVGIRQKRGEERSGDSISYFKTERGELYMIISDGMGSGKKASAESGSFVRLLEGFIKAGMRPDTALRLLCPAYAIKCEGDTFTTCDILRVDLHTGEAEIYKCGAAPSYIKDKQAVRRITGSSIPAGVLSREPIEADRTSIILHRGDVIVMVSDGVTDNYSDSWLTRLLNEAGDISSGDLAGRILEIAAAKSGCGDDLSVLVASLE